MILAIQVNGEGFSSPTGCLDNLKIIKGFCSAWFELLNSIGVLAVFHNGPFVTKLRGKGFYHLLFILMETNIAQFVKTTPEKNVPFVLTT